MITFLLPIELHSHYLDNEENIFPQNLAGNRFVYKDRLNWYYSINQYTYAYQTTRDSIRSKKIFWD